MGEEAEEKVDLDMRLCDSKTVKTLPHKNENL